MSDKTIANILIVITWATILALFFWLGFFVRGCKAATPDPNAPTIKLNDCQRFCIDNWLKGMSNKNEQGCNFVGWAVAAKDGCYLAKPTLSEIAKQAETWMQK